MAASALSIYLLAISLTYASGNCLDQLMDDNGIVEIFLNKSQYCFESNHTLRVNCNHTNFYLRNLDRSEKFITSTRVVMNTTIVYYITPPYATEYCRSGSDDFDADAVFVVLLITFIVMVVLIIPVAIANVCLQLLVKELHTVPGLLIVTMSTFITLATTFFIAWFFTIFSSFIACKVLLIIFFYFMYAYEATKLVYVFHFTYLMYKSYRLRSQEPRHKRYVIIKYLILVMGVSLLCLLIAIIADLPLNGSVGSFCDDHGNEGFFVMAGPLALPVSLVIIVLITGLVFYYKLNRNCFNSTSVRVPITLGSTAGLISIIAVVCLASIQVSGIFYFAVLPSSIVLEQVLIFVLFLSSPKVRSKLSCRKRTPNITPLPVDTA